MLEEWLSLDRQNCHCQPRSAAAMASAATARAQAAMMAAMAATAATAAVRALGSHMGGGY